MSSEDVSSSAGSSVTPDAINGPIIASIVIVVIIAVAGIAAALAVLCGCRCCRKRKEKTSDFLDDRTSYEAWSSKASLGTYELQHPSRVATRDPSLDFVMGPGGDRNYHQNRLSGWKSSLRNSTTGRPL